MNIPVTIMCYLDQDPGADIRCFTEEDKDYPVLSLGPVTFFPTREQLVAIYGAIDRFLAPEPITNVQCDLCAGTFNLLEGGQSTADTCVCGDCIRRLGGPKARSINLPF